MTNTDIYTGVLCLIGGLLAGGIAFCVIAIVKIWTALDSVEQEKP